jgi:hypothetical protein
MRQNIIGLDWLTQCARPLRRLAVLWLLHFLTH